MAMSDGVTDDIRHKQEEAARNAKRKEKKKHKSASQKEKIQRRKEHAQKYLSDKGRSKDPRRRSQPPPPPPPGADVGGSSSFAALFAKRASGFIVDLQFRNAPPRPPVGPCLVGGGLEGELRDGWTKYRPSNAVEGRHVWGLHCEPDLSVPLAPSAMDLKGCYVDPDPKGADGGRRVVGAGPNGEKKGRRDGPRPIHPDDAALLDWKGAPGDTTAEELQERRDRARAIARGGESLASLTLTKKMKTMTPVSNKKKTGVGASSRPRFRSRVLVEQIPSFMKKTTYMSNDIDDRVHQFKSLVETKRQAEKDVERRLNESDKLGRDDYIDRTFEECLSFDIGARAKRKEVTNKASNDDGEEKKKKRKHPTKRNVEALYELPFLPDLSAWGRTYVHVIIDKIPAEKDWSRDGSKSKGKNGITPAQLRHAIVADAVKKQGRNKVECRLLVPTLVADDEGKGGAAGGEYHIPAGAYDLDVTTLREEGDGGSFIVLIDPRRERATYRPVKSRVQLGGGRPVEKGAPSDAVIVRRRARTTSEIEAEKRERAPVGDEKTSRHGKIEGGAGDGGHNADGSDGGSDKGFEKSVGEGDDSLFSDGSESSNES